MIGLLSIIAGLGSIILSGGDATAALIFIPLGLYLLLHKNEEESD